MRNRAKDAKAKVISIEMKRAAVVEQVAAEVVGLEDDDNNNDDDLELRTFFSWSWS